MFFFIFFFCVIFWDVS
jgi:hypothetical protein